MRMRICGSMLLALLSVVPLINAADLDGEVMPTIEVVSESLASNIGLHDVAAASVDAKDLEALFAEVEAHFAARADAKDAVEYAKQSRRLAAGVLGALQGGRFDEAANAASEIARTCKACHRKYKP